MSDDEITREVDPNWLTRLRENADEARDDGSDADDEHTIGNADLLDQVRAAVREARGDTPVGPSHAAVRSTAHVSTADPQAPPRGQVSFPPPDPSSPVHQAKAAPTLTFPQARWQPPPRLKPVSAATPPALLTTSTSGSHQSGRRRMLVVGITAAVAALIVGVLIGRNDSSDPAPGDDTVVSTTPTGGTTPGSTTAGTGAEVGS